MRDKRRSRAWLNWLAVTVPGVVLVSGFVLVGGFGTGQGNVALAGTSRATSSTSSAGTSATITTVSSQGVNISTSVCAGPIVTGVLELDKPLSGVMTLGLFALLQHEMPLARQFTDTGQRASATFTGSTTASFRFPTVPGGAVDYIVVVMPTSGVITNDSQLVESAVLPLCGTRKVTVTTTATTTTTSTTTDTTTVTLTQTITTTARVIVPICPVAIHPILNTKATKSAVQKNVIAHFHYLAKPSTLQHLGLVKARVADGCVCCS
jgi:hypothetical protein